MVEFKGKFDENTAKSMNNHTFKKLCWLFVLCSVIFILVGVTGIVLRTDEEDLALGIFLTVMGVLFTPLVFLLTKFAQKSLNRSMSIMSVDTTETYRFYPDRLVITQTKKRDGEEDCEYEATTSARYSYIYKVEETRDAYFMRISKMQAHVVKKADLTQGTLNELNEILYGNLGLRFKRMK